MKRVIGLCVLTTVLIALSASPLFSVEKKGNRKPVGTRSATTAESTKAIDSKATDRKAAAPSNSVAVPGKRSIRQSEPEVFVPSHPEPETQRTSAQALQIDWISINHGGAIEVASGNLKMGVSIAQPVAGEVSTGDLKMGLGFWYGAGAAGGDCLCPLQADIDGDGFPTALDLGLLVDITFIGHPDPPNPGCPTSRGDFDNDGYVTALDIARMADYLFIGGGDPCDPCNPVQATCAE